MKIEPVNLIASTNEHKLFKIQLNVAMHSHTLKIAYHKLIICQVFNNHNPQCNQDTAKTPFVLAISFDYAIRNNY